MPLVKKLRTWGRDVSKKLPDIVYGYKKFDELQAFKDQLILKCLFGIIVSTKKPTEIL